MVTENITIELTGQEVQSLIQLLDIATHAKGLQVAGNALHFANKLQSPKPKEE